MDYRDYITIEPDKRGGKPCIRSLRMTVQDVLVYLASGMTEEEILVWRLDKFLHLNCGNCLW
ncbi:MAG: DUF433 domain-containing protein [Chloroflexi bacterium]|nr:DUF433 domain-containing protein [Ardenticatenaceae bacterium]MBL1128953.1 DUF433 domain-containing protein [Chloroflexota bacterium]NOG35033.1 DUF433 domain-containing protein [Chloroflexota bacterium]GIK58143.1 MAG: hypothetical protein BroJett015_38060 [Chloroflexota bacterium]